MWLLETIVNLLLFVYVGVLVWLYTSENSDREGGKDE